MQWSIYDVASYASKKERNDSWIDAFLMICVYEPATHTYSNHVDDGRRNIDRPCSSCIEYWYKYFWQQIFVVEGVLSDLIYE